MHHGPKLRTQADDNQHLATPAVSFKEESAVHALSFTFLDDLTQESGTASVFGDSPNDGDGLDDLGQARVGFGTSTVLPEGLVSDIVPGSFEDQANNRFSQYSVDADAMYGDFTDERIWSSPAPDETQPVSTAVGAGLMPFDGISLPNSQVPRHDFETLEQAAPLPTLEALLNSANSAHETGGRYLTEPHAGCARSSHPTDATLTIDRRPGFQSAYFGLSGESDPYLLRHYLYNDADEFPFLRVIYRRTRPWTPSRLDHSSITGHHSSTHDENNVPVQFLLTSNELSDELRRLGPTDHLYDHESVRKELNDLVGEDVGQRLVILFVQYVYPTFPVISRSQIVNALGGHFKSASSRHASLPTYLLAAIYASALPFIAYDDILCVSSVYKKPPAQRLWQMVYDGVQTTLHTPQLATISGALLYLHKPRVGVQHVSADTSFSWSMATSVVGLATSLGLHLDCRSWSIPPWEKRLRRRLWWMTFSEATWRSLLLGRPAVIAPDQWNVSELTFLDFEIEELLQLGDDTETNDFAEKLRHAIDESDESMVSQHLATLTVIADNIYRCLYTIRATEKLADDLAGSIRAIKPLREELKLWYTGLPIYLNTPKVDPERTAPAAPSSAACLKFAYLTLEILLYRALLRPLGSIDLEDVSNAVPLTEHLRNDLDANITAQEPDEGLRNEIELIICAAENCARIVSTFTVELMSWDFAGFWYAFTERKACKDVFEDMSLGILRLDAMYWSNMNKIFRINRHVAQVIKDST
ncbi:fungal specific transcription factor [Colletotrichum nymphaeae SA-01]|uniref:Fungal specific transcription factor n=1 Tax=Colletotrichum nymphaeae SA-01 TaxID=1460502 RepID=A0A135SCP6_9PEZI|nr:fungal specific transcription factor [Colletotrichum nymphaeae SA-01]